MTADTRPKDTIRDAFEAMLWFLACLIGPLRPRKITPAEEIGALAACEVELDPNGPDEAPLLALRDLIQRAAEEHNRRAGYFVRAATGTLDGDDADDAASYRAAGDFTPERIREARERCERATPGPWLTRGDALLDDHIQIKHIENGVTFRIARVASFDRTAENAAFIAHAREDLPAALAEIERRATHAATWKALARRLMRRYRSERRGHDLTRSDRKKHRAEIERLTAELAARAPADASLEARAEALFDMVQEMACLPECPDWGQWIAVVRAVDASRPAAPEVDDDEPLTRGTRVRTVAHLTALFSPSLHPHRRPNADGKIVRRMTSGDIYYDVRHDDGTVAGYERSELIDLTADASRPGLTEEQAADLRERAAFIAETCSGGDHTISNRDLIARRIRELPLRASRGETGPAPSTTPDDGPPLNLGPGVGGKRIGIRYTSARPSPEAQLPDDAPPPFMPAPRTTRACPNCSPVLGPCRAHAGREP